MEYTDDNHIDLLMGCYNRVRRPVADDVAVAHIFRVSPHKEIVWVAAATAILGGSDG